MADEQFMQTLVEGTIEDRGDKYYLRVVAILTGDDKDPSVVPDRKNMAHWTVQISYEFCTWDMPMPVFLQLCKIMGAAANEPGR